MPVNDRENVEAMAVEDRENIKNGGGQIVSMLFMFYTAKKIDRREWPWRTVRT